MNLSDIISHFKEQRVVVIGDIMLDTFVNGEAIKISPEAPVPVIKYDSEMNFPGGAANVASNIASLNGNVSLFGAIGDDEAGIILSELLKEGGVDFFPDYLEGTTRKTRITSQNQHIVRIDKEKIFPKFLTHPSLEEEIRKAGLIVVSDYAKGVVTPELMERIKSYGKTIVADPKPKNAELYKGVSVLKLNKSEALQISQEQYVYYAGKKLREMFNSNIIVTRGSEGATLFNEYVKEFPASAKNISDLTGAGDTFLATLALSLASGAELDKAILISNYAAGIAVSKKGTYSVRLNELEREILGEEVKLKKFDELAEIITGLKSKGKKIVWTNGGFDLLHEGHIRHLKESKRYGDYLVVGINSDSSIRASKEPPKPIISEASRAEILCALGCVDYAIIFSEPNTTKYLSSLKPDVYVKGGEYCLDTINQEERKIVERYGGRIAFTSIKVNSTTDIIKKIRKTGSSNDK